MWFKCGNELLNSAVTRELEKTTRKRDNGGIHRVYAFIRLLSETADDHASDIQSAEDLARLVNTTPKQASVIWDVCIRFNVLRRGEFGYSAKEWMMERGILGDTNKWRTANGGYEQRQESKNSFM